MPVSTRASSATPTRKEQVEVQSKISGFFSAQKKSRINRKKVVEEGHSQRASSVTELKRSLTPEPIPSPAKKATPEKVNSHTSDENISIAPKPKVIRRRINFEEYDVTKLNLPQIKEEKNDLYNNDPDNDVVICKKEVTISEDVSTTTKDSCQITRKSSRKCVKVTESEKTTSNEATEKIKEITELMKTNKTVRAKLKKNVRNLQEYHDLLAKKKGISKLVEQGNAIKAASVIERKTLILSPTKTTPIKKPFIGKGISLVDKLNNLPSTSSGLTDAELPERPLNPLAYGKVAGLNQEIKDVARKELPNNLSFLLEVFESTDKIFALQMSHIKRNPLEEMMDSVKRKIKKAVHLKQYAQILHLYQSSYKITLEKPYNPLGMFRNKSSKEEYIIEPNLNDDLNGFWTPTTPPHMVPKKIEYTPTKLISPIKGTTRRTPSKKLLATPVKNQIDPILQPRLEPWRLICRAKIFKFLLYKYLDKKHDEFLLTKKIVLTDEQKSRMKKFHPDFVAEAIDDVPEFDLPKPSKMDDNTKKTMKDYFDSIEEPVATLPESVLRTVELLRSPEKKALLLNKKCSIPLTPTKFKEQQEEIKAGKKLTLLERIKLKEKQKKLQSMLRDPENEARMEKLEKLEKNLLKHICAYYGIKKCTSASVDELLDKLLYSIKTINRDQCIELIDFLVELAPNNFSMATVRGKRYLKMATSSLNSVMEIVKKELTICKEKNKF
uniref:CDT1 domain-containing protein n=1 Tax=Parastrongyloides trichosuri TaxID=131310 RepID=A0A0N4Z8Q0_PARTI